VINSENGEAVKYIQTDAKHPYQKSHGKEVAASLNRDEKWIHEGNSLADQYEFER
jgi:hypothetical protein